MSNLALWTPEQTQLISTTIAPGCSNDELRLFAYACQRTGLDPFSRQIYAIKRGGKMTIQGIDGLRSMQSALDSLTDLRATGADLMASGLTYGLTASHLLRPRPLFTAKAARIHLPQLLALLISMQGRGLWSKMPSVMIAKCSEAQALRRAFPADLSGVYSTDEMDQAVEPVTVTTAPALPAKGDAKIFQAGKVAIAKADSIAKLTEVTDRMETRKGDLSDEQYAELLKLALEREDSLAEVDPFDD
jgi:hypothetical protein